MKQSLGKYIYAISERNKSDEEIPVYSVTNTMGFCTDYFDKEVASKDKTTYKIVPYGCFAYNPSRINVGSIGFQDQQDRVLVSPLYVVFGVSDALDKKYLYHYMKSAVTGFYIDSLSRGGVRNNLKFDVLSTFQIPVPEMSEQKRIANIFDELDRLIRICNEQIKELNILLDTKYLNIFSDEKNIIDRTTIKEIAEQTTVGIANSATHAYRDDGVILLRNQNIRINYLDDSDLIYIDPEFANSYEGKALKEDDIIITRTGANVGMACLVPKKYEGCQTFTTLILRLKKDIEVSPNFVCHYINSPIGKQFVDAKKVGGAQPNLGAKVLENMPIVIPSSEAQEEFNQFTVKINSEKKCYERSCEELILLKRTLDQKYFC